MVSRSGGVSRAVLAHRHRPVALLALADHEHVGDLPQLAIADLARDRLVARVQLHARPPRAQPLGHGGAVLVEAIGHRQHNHLHGREPERKLTGVVLDQDADEALERSQQRTMDHRRAVLGVVGPRVEHVEALGHRIVQLHGAELPRAPDRVGHVQIDLGPVEGPVARRDHVRPLRLLERPRQSDLAAVPQFVGADALFRAQAERDLDVGEPEGAVDRVHEVEEPEDLVLELVERREDVRVVLRKRPHARQPRRHARALVTVEAAEVGIPHGQVAIGPESHLV